jgi:hypothetical protein
VAHRTFKLASPLMHGDDIHTFQRTINQQFRTWKVNNQIDEDGEYGSMTREATVQVVYGLGISRGELEHGVTPAVRIKIRNRDHRTQLELQREQERADWVRRFRRRFDGHGPKAAIAYARKHVGLTEIGQSNRGPLIDRWERFCSVIGAPWCGCFCNACLMAAGFPAQPFLRFCPWIEGRAKSGEGGWSWHSMSQARPGDLILYGAGTAEHVGLYVGSGVTIEGNTSSGTGGSQANGGGVYVRRRNFSNPGFPARGAARPPYRGR